MADFPKCMFHKDGETRTINTAEEAKALGSDWSESFNDNVLQAMRRQSGCIGEVIEPVQRVRLERTDR